MFIPRITSSINVGRNVLILPPWSTYIYSERWRSLLSLPLLRRNRILVWPAAISTARFTTKTHFFKVGPVTWRVIHGNLHPWVYPFRDDDDSLEAKPDKFGKLGIRSAGVIDEPSVVAHSSLVDLVLIIALSTHHDIQPFDALGYESHKFSNSGPSPETATTEKAVVLATRTSPHLYWSQQVTIRRKQGRETYAFICLQIL